MATSSFLKRVSTNIVEATTQEFAQEAAITRRLLERTPADQLAWKPHPKSMSLGALALHLASSPEVFAGWIDKEKSIYPKARRNRSQTLSAKFSVHTNRA